MRIGRAASVLIALVILLGTASSVLAGDGKRIVRSRHTAQTQIIIRDTGANSTPRPVADETPIDPKLLNNASGNDVPASDSNRPPLKRKTIRRW